MGPVCQDAAEQACKLLGPCLVDEPTQQARAVPTSKLSIVGTCLVLLTLESCVALGRLL